MASTYEPIATSTLGSAAATVTFSSIAATYTDLKVVISGSVTTGGPNIYLQYNGDTASNYSQTILYGDGSSTGSFRNTNNTKQVIGDANTTIGTTIADIMNYSNTTTYKTNLARNSMSAYVEAWVGLWRSTSAINSVLIGVTSSTFIAGSTFTLYGIKAA
jgi:hypothetical protein